MVLIHALSPSSLKSRRAINRIGHCILISGQTLFNCYLSGGGFLLEFVKNFKSILVIGERVLRFLWQYFDGLFIRA